MTTVLFVCPDNSLLGPLAEAYLNARGAGVVRAFSAGLEPEAKLHPSVGKLLAVRNLPAQGLEPKSLDIFLMPMAPRPDRVVVLADMETPELPGDWQGWVGVTKWPVAGKPPFPVSGDAAAEYFRRIRQAVDRALPRVYQPRTAA
ncbi:low molecular weight phosphatase family protein [Roseibium sp.]|uniref:arsenate-mycothiol transferase ArsC n=1 Tax=Roseibium sp. TaxID=1936156 RepID=UPI003A984009